MALVRPTRIQPMTGAFDNLERMRAQPSTGPEAPVFQAHEMDPVDVVLEERRAIGDALRAELGQGELIIPDDF